MKKLLIPILLFITVIALSGCSKSYEKKPFFAHTEKLMVCKRPYSDSSSCNFLNVRNHNDETMTVYFKNGKNIELEDMYCTETIHDDDIFQGVDDEGNIWDILPIGSSIE